MKPLTDIQREVLVAYAECNMNMSQAAKKLYMHHNNVAHHLELIRKKSDLNPRNLFDLIKLLQFTGITNYVEVVRCKDCIDVQHCLVSHTLGENGYCSYGDLAMTDEKGENHDTYAD